MNKRTFMFWNILGSVGWGFEWVLTGFIFAQSLNLAELWLSRAGLFFAFLVIIGAILYFLKWLIFKQGKRYWPIAVAFYGFLGYLLMRFSKSWNKKVNILFAAIFVIIAIGFSRVYLGEHYVSDVWSGYLVGGMWLIIAVCFSEWLRHKRKGDQSIVRAIGARPISLALVFIAILFYGVFAMNYRPPLATVPSRNIVVVAKSTDVFTNEELKYTDTLIGDKQEPINFIFLARNVGQMAAALQEAGWVLTDKAGISSFMKAVKALMLKEPYPSAPMSPSFWDAKTQDMGFANVSGINWLKNAHHLKIWRTNFSLENRNNIYVGLVTANDGFEWWIIPKISPDLDTERESLFRDLSHTEKIESHLRVQLVKPLIGHNFIGDPFFTDGEAYVISLK